MSDTDKQRHPEDRREEPESSPLDRRAFLSKSLPGPLILLGVVQIGLNTGCGTAETPPSKTGVPGGSEAEVPEVPAESTPAQSAEEESGEPVYKASEHEYAMAVDPDRCIGCGRCVEGCKAENDVPREPFYFRTWIERYVVQSDGETVVTSPDGGIRGFPPVEEAEILRTFFVPKLCNQCSNPPCVQVCPVGATYQTEDGVVLVDESYCIGCRYCIQGCPYGARFMNPVTHVADKCTFCYHRLVKGLVPACVEVCPTQARIFGELGVRSSPLARFTRLNKIQTLKSHLNTEPKVYYANLDGEVS